MSHTFFAGGRPKSMATANLVQPLIYQACEKANINLNIIYFGRLFLTFPIPNKTKHNLWHIDMPNQDHIAAVYYVNDSTGPTIISNLTGYNYNNNEINSLDNVEILESIDPKKGRIVFFNGAHWHASSNPSLNHRCIINFDLG